MASSRATLLAVKHAANSLPTIWCPPLAPPSPTG